MPSPGEVFEELMAVIVQRRDNPSTRSYTATLLGSGLGHIGDKVLEEAGEVVAASAESDVAGGRDHIIYEAGDLLYHLFVLLAARGIELAEVTDELARRFGTSGLDEKASRAGGQGE